MPARSSLLSREKIPALRRPLHKETVSKGHFTAAFARLRNALPFSPLAFPSLHQHQHPPMSHQPYYDTPNHLGPPGPSQGRPFSAGPSQPYSRSRSRSPPRRRDDPYGAPPPRRDDDGGGYPGGVGYTRSSGFAREDPYHGGSGVRSGPPGGVGGRDRWPNDRYNQGGPSTEPGAPPGWGVDHYAGGPRGPPPVQRGPGWLDPRQEAPWPQHNGGGSYGPVVCRTLFHFGIVFI